MDPHASSTDADGPTATGRRRRARLWGGAGIVIVALAVWWGARGPTLSKATGKAVENRLVLDLGAHVGRAAGTVEVERGDTLGHIAARVLGSAKRWPDIVALNPGLDPRRIKPGDRLRVPPTVGAGAAESAAGLAFYLWREREAGGGELVPLGHDTEVPLGALGGRLLALPIGRVREGEGALREASAFAAQLPQVEGLVLGPRIAGVPHVPEADEAARILHRVRLGPTTDPHLEATVELERIDAKGRVLEPVPAESGHVPRALLLLVLLVLVVVGAAVVAFRQDRAMGVEAGRFGSGG